jgi:hypothetical protein
MLKREINLLIEFYVYTTAQFTSLFWHVVVPGVSRQRNGLIFKEISTAQDEGHNRVQTWQRQELFLPC